MSDRSVPEVWKEACHLLRQTLSQDVYERWIAVIEPGPFEEGVLRLRVANDFYLSWLEEHYSPLIRQAIQSVTGEEASIRLEVRAASAMRTAEEPSRGTSHIPVASHPIPVPSKPSAAPRAHAGTTGNLNSSYTFDTFVVGGSNNFGHAAALAVAQAPARAYNPLFIYGGVGLGKTHLMQAIGHYIGQSGRKKVSFVSSEEFTNEFIYALQKQALVQFRRKYRGVDVLLIDDIQFLGGKERLQEEFFHTFNTLFDNHKQIVLTCDRPAAEIPGLEQRLVSRFEWGLVTELELPDIETRIAILRNKAQQIHLMDVPDEVLQYIAAHIRSNIRRLEGALIRAASYASLTGEPLSIETLEHLLRDTVDQEAQQATLSIEQIQRTVAEYFDIRYSDMTSKRRPANIALPRQVAMYLARDLTRHSLPSIGESFMKNHATVLYACRKVEQMEQEDPGLRQTLTLLRQRLGRRG